MRYSEPPPSDWDPDMSSEYKEGRECHCCGQTYLINEEVEENLCPNCWLDQALKKVGDEDTY
jgi:hypothetical protein